MEDKNLNPQEENNTPEVVEMESTAPEADAKTAEEANKNDKKGGFTELLKEKKALVIVIAVLAVVLVCGLAVLLVSVLGVDTSVATPDESTIETTLEATAPSTTVADGMEDTTWPDGTPYEDKQDWNALKKINTDIKGWITFHNAPINYPVLESEEDGYGYQYYLYRSYDKSDDYAGSIFIDHRSKDSVKSRNILTHGHSMRDGSMYMSLIDYGKYEIDMDFYKKNPTLFFNTPEGNEQWIVFAVVKTNTLEDHGDFFNYLMGSFDSDAQFMNYVYNMKVRSLIDVPVPINEDDQLITLSTCSYEYDEFRTVVCARKIRNNEKITDYINNAKPAENPVWPEVYYYNHSGERPEITTFKTEMQGGNINWYDGKGELEGSEWLVMTTGNSTYTVTFINYDGSIISTQSVVKGHAAVAPPDPVKPNSNGYRYEFIEWCYDFDNVTCNMTIAPKFQPIYIGE
ncbi:MAG: class B sortase [Ruminococcus sp.]|nr:class B sortase [Ruminococcus sp.]